MQIKFRGKSLSTGEWVYGWYIREARALINGLPALNLSQAMIVSYIVFSTDGKLEIHEVDHNTVGQYIRDNDKDGKEIYEGDIVRGYFAILDFKGNEHGKVETVIVDDIAYAREYLEDVQQRTLEIIGNIHDNPTLLTQ